MITTENGSLLPEAYYTAQQLARHFHVSPAAIRAWVYRGRLTGVKAGGRWLFTSTQVQALLERRESP